MESDMYEELRILFRENKFERPRKIYCSTEGGNHSKIENGFVLQNAKLENVLKRSTESASSSVIHAKIVYLEIDKHVRREELMVEVSKSGLSASAYVRKV